MVNNSVILVRVLGNTKGLSRSLAKANRELGGLDRISNNITASFRTAAIGAAIFGAAAIGAGAAGAVALAAIPALVLGIGVAFAATNQKVQQAFGGLKDHVVGVMKDITAPFIPVLVKGAGLLQQAFDNLVPSLRRIFAAAAPLLDGFFKALPGLARLIGPALEGAFKAGIPVLQAFGRGVKDVVVGIDGMFKALGASSGEFAKFASAFMSGLGQLLPAVGRLLAALAPIGTTLLQVLIPALITLSDFLASTVGPAFEAVSGFLERHATAAKVVGIALLSLVVTIKAAQLAMSLFSAVTLAFTTVAKVVRLAIIVWKNAQLALNLVMMANPIGLVIAAIVALVAIFVIAYKKSDTFRRIVDASWRAIKAASVAVFNFLKTFIMAIWNGLLAYFKFQFAVYKTLFTVTWKVIKTVVTGAWNAIKAVTHAVWTAITTLIRAQVALILTVIRGIKGKVVGAIGQAWNWLKGAGRDVIRGFINGIKSMAGALIGAIKSTITDKLPGFVKKALGIGSPSKLFKQYGRWTVEGLALGLKDTGGLVSKAATGLARKVSDGFSAPELTLRARPAFAAGVGPSAASQTVQITVQVPVSANPADTGREVVKAVDAYYKQGGRRL